jgi:hypothetical protein
MLNLVVFAALLRAPPLDIHSSKTPKAEAQTLLEREHKHSNGEASTLVCESSDANSLEHQGDEINDSWSVNVKTGSGDSPQNSSVDATKKNTGASCETEVDAQDKKTSDQSVIEDADLIKKRDTISIASSLKTEHKILRHIYLFTDFGFDMYFLSSVLWNACVAALIAFGPDFANERGISAMDSALLLTIFGGANFAGSLVGAVIGNIWTKQRISQYAVACIIAGGFICAFPQGNTFGDFAAILSCAGLFFGIILGLLVVVLIDLIGTVNLGDGMGWLMLANGVGAFLGPILTGMPSGQMFALFS